MMSTLFNVPCVTHNMSDSLSREKLEKHGRRGMSNSRESIWQTNLLGTLPKARQMAAGKMPE